MQSHATDRVQILIYSSCFRFLSCGTIMTSQRTAAEALDWSPGDGTGGCKFESQAACCHQTRIYIYIYMISNRSCFTKCAYKRIAYKERALYESFYIKKINRLENERALWQEHLRGRWQASRMEVTSARPLPFPPHPPPVV